jgi:hypothetical protein
VFVHGTVGLAGAACALVVVQREIQQALNRVCRYFYESKLAIFHEG